MGLSWQFCREKIPTLSLEKLDPSTEKSQKQKESFRYLLRIRFSPALAGIVAGMTSWGLIFASLVSIGYGFLGGVFFTLCLFEKGGSGLLLFCAIVFPQTFFYLAALFLAGGSCAKLSEQRKIQGRLPMRMVRKTGLWFLLAMILLLWGILMEAYVNPGFLGAVLQKIR